MKKLITILFLFAFSVNAQFKSNLNFQLSEDWSFKIDKQYHAIAGATISGTVFTLVYIKTKDESLAMRAGWMSACTAGFLKEFSDGMQGKEISLSDLLYTTLSGVAVGYIFKVVVKHRKKKIQRANDKILYSLDNPIFKKL